VITRSPGSSSPTGGGATTGAAAPGTISGYAGTAYGRSRDGHPITGSAAARPIGEGGNDWVSFPMYGPWGRWYPWYGSGFGWSLGFITYNPWCYGATAWGWGRYGMWYDPFYYAPYYGPLYSCGYSGFYSYGVGGGYSAPKARKTTGSLRLKVNPKEAKVYVDNALAGTVDEFDGLSDHLQLEGGRHVLELRADGYETYRVEIVIATGKTQTERISLKKKK
jgi:hypothetical protein